MVNKLNKIIIHWTAGRYKANSTEREYYHYLIEYDSKSRTYNIIEGNHKPEDNIDCKDGNYAQHCGGGNTGAIGIALCGMMNSKYPLTTIQCEAMFKKVAELCITYGILVTDTSVLTHCEFGKRNPTTSSFGKPDIDNLPCYCIYNYNNVGSFIRKKVNWYIKMLKGQSNG